MPGVGNVIKCEGLFIAGLHPDTPASSCTAQQLSVLVRALHSFAWEWHDNTK
jgi:formamidopyrimidine-DNA glycosylase